jgi:hypothetical protein
MRSPRCPFGLLGIARNSFYYRPRPEVAEELDILKRLDRIFTSHPVYGSRRLQVALLREGISIGRRNFDLLTSIRKRAQSIMLRGLIADEDFRRCWEGASPLPRICLLLIRSLAVSFKH